MSLYTGITVAVVAAVTSWTKYAKYEFLKANHNSAANQFGEIAEDVARYVCLTIL